jgi:hypothetical protein
MSNNIGAVRGPSGEYGFTGNTGTGAVTGAFQGILCVTDCVFSAVSGTDITNFNTTATHKAGLYIPGAFSSVAASSGSFYAYNRRYGGV